MTLFYILIMLCGVALAVRLYRKFKNLRRYYYPTSFEFCKEETIYKLKPFMTEYEYRFYNSCYPNEEEYVIARVKNEIEKRLNDLS